MGSLRMNSPVCCTFLLSWSDCTPRSIFVGINGFYNSEFYDGNHINPKEHISQDFDPMKDGALFFNNRIKDLLTSFPPFVVDFLITLTIGTLEGSLGNMLQIFDKS